MNNLIIPKSTAIVTLPNSTLYDPSGMGSILRQAPPDMAKYCGSDNLIEYPFQDLSWEEKLMMEVATKKS